jgi:protein TonB
MKSDMLLSVITAVAIHAFIFCVPLLKTKNNKTRAHIYEPIPISIISPQETVAATPPAKASVKASIKPPSAGRRHVSGRKKAASHQNKLINESALDRMPEDQGQKIDRSPPVKTASAAGDIHRKLPRDSGPTRDNRAAKANIVYARPRYKDNPPPHYPEVARRRGYEGKTLLKVKVLKNGKAGKIEVEESSGFKVLDTAALRSVRGWTFVPGSINGKRTEQWIRVPIRFVLK